MSIGRIKVPNKGPLDAKIYCVGEAPGSDETDQGEPFVGYSGVKLRNCLTRNGASEESVRFTNLAQYRPQDNKFAFLLRSPELRQGIEELTAELREHRPNVIAALGNWPLYYLTGRRGKKAAGTGIGKWRGSILPCILPGCEGLKVVATYHPAYILRNSSAYPVFDTDIKRVVSDSQFRELRYPERRLILDPRGDELEEWTKRLCESEYLGCDIETIKRSSHILCHGFSPSPDTSVVIAHSDTDFHRQDCLNRIYASRAKKIFHNGGIFDIPILEVAGFQVAEYYWDTMVAQHSMWVELPKSLDYLSSIYTRQPYYKTAGRGEIPEDAKGWSEKFDKKELYIYNGTDTSVTIDIAFQQFKEVEDGPKEWRRTIEHEMRQMAPAARISFTGLLIDQERRALLKQALEVKWAVLQYILNHLTGFVVNVNSPKQMISLLYDKDKLALPPKKTREGKFVTDEDAIVSLLAFCKDKMGRMKPGGNAIVYWRTRLESLNTILIIRGVRKLLSSYINVKISEDGRFKSMYKPCVTDTWRWSCAKHYDGTGGNAQTFPREVFELKNYQDDEILSKFLPIILQQSTDDVVGEEDETIETEEALAV